MCTSTNSDRWGAPHSPAGPSTSLDALSLATIRDALSTATPDQGVEDTVLATVARWREDLSAVEPLSEIRAVIDAIRALPRGDRRLSAMNTLVRTLGQPGVLATVLDVMRDSAQRTGTREQQMSLVSQTASQHCIYGWCGQTLIMTSGAEPTDGTLEPELGVREMLGESPLAVWGLSMHIWQPNPRAKGFPFGKPAEPDVLVEPPHSHPFDFVSMVSVGDLRQSLYAQRSSEADGATRGAGESPGRYDGVGLEHVDGVWPPHREREPAEVLTLESRVLLSAGDSYFMPCDRIHDVEVDATTARTRPAITLFLASEAAVKPHVYMSEAMATFHAENPRLKYGGQALPSADWHAKLQAVAAYLRGEEATLSLDDIVKYEGEYAFFHS